MIKRLVITGYKQHEIGVFDDKHPGVGFIKKALENRLLGLIDDGLEWVILSGQLGVETWAAQLVIELKQSFPDLKYAIITPFLEQEKNWNDTKKETYQMICANADFQTSVTKKPYEGPWQFIEKNKFIIRNSDGLLIIYDEENEGSPKFMKELAMKYAEKNDYQIITISADDLQLVATEEQQNQWSE
ncbi:DUF1273 domain-containing protein [Paenisporosarcina quisquiliarum]|uniref:UPF0398 protein M9R32_01705 n=1 Tax=Paenisporosarcina quisquiliarum TaxID=365346 RepID=A0A9X3LDJ6_9BACL|nr:DUF1273 domain-containing protein [Paenisporosarcina quisquiliarum]MCZ8535903.1 DUF1273 domain-containing protein [Paenisporosarcina quisquiliarum]